MRRQRRTKKGSTIAETGPMLYIFFILVFFPMMDILAMGCQFGLAWYCNFITVRECAVTKSSTWNTAGTGVCAYQAGNFRATALAQFLGVSNIVQVASAEAVDAGTNTQNVDCVTTVTARPFIGIPVPFGATPGINAPVNWRIASQRPRDEMRN